jgi:DNA-binding IclR family transcriptional regulator
MTEDEEADCAQSGGYGGARAGAGASGAKRTAAARVLALLEAFSRGGGSLTLSEISRYADLTLTTTHRLANEVREWGGLELDDDGKYRLSRKILDLASASTRALRLRETALPHLLDLHQRTSLTVTLAVRDGRDVVYLEALRSHPNYTGANRIGGRLRMHVTATGLVLLAFSDADELREYLREPLKGYTEHTITEVPALLDHLRAARRNGYAIASQYLSLEAGSVAAPVLEADGTVETAVGVVYFTGQQDPRSLVDQVRFTAHRISRSLQDSNVTPPDPRTIDFNLRHAGLI